MRKYILLVFLLLSSTVFSAYSQRYTVTGKVITSKEKTPIELATLYVSNNGVWAVTNGQGEFALINLPAGKAELKVSSLGYVTRTVEVNVQGNVTGVVIMLQEDNLALDEVVITATRKKEDLTTTYVIDRAALDHNQVLSITDIGSLLPGGKTAKELNLADNDDRLAIHSKSTSEHGNASFGTAIEVDGVRIDNNAAFNETKGTSTRNIGTTNIESIEVVAGIPSVEYGDLTGGLIKVNTKQGETPFTVDLSTQPNTKQAAISKGIRLGAKAGVLNTGFEYTRSVTDLASPHKDYKRHILSLNYSNTFNAQSSMPLRLNVGFSGNIGGYDSKADPDSFKDNFTKKRDNAFRGNVRLNWLLNKPWITTIEASGTVSYADRLTKINKDKSSSATQAFIHSTEEGYFLGSLYDPNSPDAPIILGPVGSWYELSYRDSKPITYTAKLKAEWARKFGAVTNKLMIGGEFKSSGNNGEGLYYDDMRYAPTWRSDRHSDKPFMNNFSWYAEDKVTLPSGSQSKLEVIAGIRSDITRIKDSEYGTAQSFSPRFNAKYTFWENADKFVSTLSLRGGWGKAVKLPSFEVLYPSPHYDDNIAFAPGATAEGTIYYAYHTRPYKAIHNPDLKWQYSKQGEIGLEATIKGTTISITAFRSRTYNPYLPVYSYSPTSFNYTSPSALNNIGIPSENRQYAIDRETGQITVSDKTGAIADKTLNYTTRNTYNDSRKFVNGSPVERRGLDWTISFPQITALRTSVSLNGNFYYYKGVDETLIARKPASTTLMTDGRPYQFVGYYTGTSVNATSSLQTQDEAETSSYANASVANGKLTKEINTNMMIKTHIPKIRLVVSLTIEATLYKYARNLSEYNGANRGIALDSPDDYTGGDNDIYRGDRYVAVYPLYYSTWENPDERKPFMKNFLDAKENNPALYNDLCKLVSKSSTSYYFNPSKISSYFSANINVTKEIGKYASLSFYANNFLNNLSRVKNSQNDTEATLYNSSYIPRYYYGLSLRIKL